MAAAASEDRAASGAGTSAESGAAPAPAPAGGAAAASASASAAAPVPDGPARTLSRAAKTKGVSSTTSTLFLSSTMAVPDADEVILGKAAVLYCQLAADAAAGKRCPVGRADDMLLFCEDLYVPARAKKREAQIRAAAEASAASKALLSATRDAEAAGAAADTAAVAEARARAAAADDAWTAVTAGAVPDIEQLYSFSAKVHEMGQFSPETVVLSLILINRLASTSHIPVGPATWRLVGLIGTLLAQKLWDDASVANSDFPTLLKAVLPGADISVREINRLERRFLGLIKYKVTFTGSLYARYYFELRTIAEENHKKFRLAPLSKEQAERLEARSRSKAETLRGGSALASRRAKTSDDGLAPRSRAVLS